MAKKKGTKNNKADKPADEEKDDLPVGEDHEISDDALLDEAYDDEEDDFFDEFSPAAADDE